MAKSHHGRKPQKRRNATFSRSVIAIVIGAFALVSIPLFSMGIQSSNSAHAMPNQKKYKATRAVVVDRQTGQRRLPNQQEVEEMVANLAVLAARPEDLPQTSVPGGAVVVDLEGGFGGVMLGRPNEDGTWETKCVFTFEEGAEFLGLVEDNSTE